MCERKYEFIKETYDFIKGHLKYQDTEIVVPGTNLYENFLNAWNNENKWTTGGPGTIATAYTWHAYNTMADVAQRLGKDEDAETFKTKADAIKAEAKESLWDTDSGVYGEYRDYFGHKRLNTAPDLSSVYTPIDLGMTDYTESHQMLRYTDYAIDSEYIDGHEFKWSSNRSPKFYSSYGLYQQEVLNNALAYFQTGEKEKGYDQSMASMLPMYIGTEAGSGVVSHVSSQSGLKNAGHLDFGDTTGMFQRTVITGLFGIMMDKAHGKAQIMPGFPDDWDFAKYTSDYINYSYKYENDTDKFEISTPDNTSLQYVMKVPARTSKVESVKVNGVEINDFTVTKTADGGISVKLKNNTENAVNITADFKTISGKTSKTLSINAGATSDEIIIPLADINDLTPGNNKVTAVITGDVKLSTETEFTDWNINSETVTETKTKTVTQAYIKKSEENNV